jgi:DNA-binding LacI/PurR family transcriptional regulator
MEMASWQNINLTTIHNPIKQIIRTSIDVIEAMLIDDTRKPQAQLFDCHVVERGTLRPAP